MRFLISFLVVALVPLVSASAVFIVLGRNTVRDQALRQLESIVQIQKQRVEYRMAQGLERLDQAKSRTLLRQGLGDFAVSPGPVSRDEITRSLDDIAAGLPSFKELSVLDTNGTVIASTDPSIVGKDESSAAYFQKGKAGDDVSAFFRGPEGELHEYLAGPVTIDGKTRGVLAIDASADDLTHLMKDYSGLGSTGETVLAEKTPGGGARFLGPTRFGEQSPLSTVVPHETQNVPINIALDGKSEILTNSVDYRGKPVLAATRFLENPPLGLVVKIDRSEAFSPVNRLIAVLGVVLGAAVLLVVVASILLSRTITRPILALTGVAEAVSAGDLSRRADINRSDEIGTLAAAYNTMTDELVEERAGLERKVAERTAELASSNMELDGYAHSVSHDLRGPISSINLAASLLEEMLDGPLAEGDREEMRMVVKQVFTSTRRSFALINDLLTLAEAGHSPSAVEEVDINETVERIIVERSDRLEAKGATVVIDGDLGNIVANPTQVYQLFNNLIVNAVKHSDAPRPVVEVRRTAAVDGEEHRFEVRDNGPGIEADDLPRIFEPFFKGRTGETGIGLATVRKIVETYGGSITASNQEGGGAVFEFVLHNYDAGHDA
ncbi:MAG: sensor histidine kinase [Candidatus Geothermincolia bacterium]